MDSLNYNQSLGDFWQNSFLSNNRDMERVVYSHGGHHGGHWGHGGFGSLGFGFGLPFLTGALIGSALAPNFYYGRPVFYPRPYPYLYPYY